MDALQLAERFTQLAKELDTEKQQVDAHLEQKQRECDEKIAEQLRLCNEKIAKMEAECKLKCERELVECRREQEEWASEKKLIADAYPLTLGPRIKFDVGGTIFRTHLDTFNKPHARETMLATLLNGHHQLHPQDQEDEVIFFDRDPGCFKYILSFLRNPATFLPPTTATEQDQLVQDAHYFLMPKEFFGVDDEKKTFKSHLWCAKYLDENGCPLSASQDVDRYQSLSSSLCHLKLCCSSEILTLKDTIIPMLSKMLGPKFTSLHRIHDGKNGYEAKKFDAAVKNRRDILTVIRATTGYVFGCFVADVYGSGSWITGSVHNFVFTLGNPEVDMRPLKLCYKRTGTRGFYSGSCGVHMGDTALQMFCTSSATTGVDPNYAKDPSFAEAIGEYTATSIAGVSGNFSCTAAEVFQVE